jgi:hypothetical protein
MRNSLLILALALTGCATTNGPAVDAVIQKVNVPISIPCTAVVPPAPEYNFSNLTVDEDIFVKTQTLLADRDLSLGYEAQLLAALDSCVK